MAGFDRSKFGSTTAEAIQKKQAELQVKRPSSGGGQPGYVKIEDGENILRICPFHADGGGDLFYEAKCVSWLDVLRPKRDKDGKVIEGETEVRRQSVFNSKVHGDLEKDLVECYIDFAKSTAIPAYANGDSSMFTEVWKKIVGDKDKKPQKGDKYSPIKPSDTSVCYASKLTRDGSGGFIWGPIERWEIKKTIKDAMTEEAVTYGEPDPFSNVDTGIPVVVTYNSKASKPSDYYKAKLLTERVGKGLEYCELPMPDEKLSELYALKPLFKLFVNVFKKSDFNMQLDGLLRLDAKLAKDHPGFSVFSFDEFLDVKEEIEAQVQDAPTDDAPDGPTDDAPAETPAPTRVQRPAPTSKPVAQTEAPKAPRANRPVATKPEPKEEEEVKTAATPVTAGQSSRQARLQALMNKNGIK